MTKHPNCEADGCQLKLHKGYRDCMSTGESHFMTEPKKEEQMGDSSNLIHPCKCTSYNGDQCYNCLNGAHHICSGKPKCSVKRSKYIGLRICSGSDAVPKQENPE